MQLWLPRFAMPVRIVDLSRFFRINHSMPKIRLIIELVVLAAALSIGVVHFRNLEIQRACASRPQPRYIPTPGDGDSALNFGDPRVLVGWSQSIFAAKLLAVVGNTPSSSS